MRSKILCFILALSLVFSFVAYGEANEIKFTDVNSEYWAYNDVMSGVLNGFFSGYTDGSFKPMGNVTRAEAVKVLATFTNRQLTTPKESIFNDMDVNAWYAPYVHVSGYLLPEKWADEKLFKADAPITREEVIYMMITAMQFDYKKAEADLSLLKAFTDKEKIGFGLEPYMALALEFNVVSGYSDNTIRPDANITRGEFAALMARINGMKEITDKRRDDVFAYMESEMTLLWKSDKDFSYSLSSLELPPEELPEGAIIFNIVKDRVYQGVPYSYAAGDKKAFLDYSVNQDEKGIYTISGLEWYDLSTAGGSVVRTGRIGNDCGASVQLAYASIGHDVGISGVVKLTPSYGYPRVGKYKAPHTINFMMTEYCAENGEDVMYEAYTQLQKGDMLIKVDRNWSSHVRMVKEVKVVYDENGKIDPEKSVVIAHDQTKDHIKKEEKYYNEELGCDVYVIGGYNIEYTFKKLYKGWCPTTAEILINPAPIPEATVSDSLTEYTEKSLFEGKITSNRVIDTAKMEIKDKNGKVVQKAIILPVRNSENHYNDSFTIKMTNFTTEHQGLIEGKVDASLLEAGDYHCTLTIRLVSGEEFVVRDYDFKI